MGAALGPDGAAARDDRRRPHGRQPPRGGTHRAGPASNEAGQALGVDLPTEPNVAQQGWLGQLKAAQGKEFDATLAELLRRAHGKVFGLVALVRDQTKNTMVRALADRANSVVLDHITVLEKTGNVDFNTLHTS